MMLRPMAKRSIARSYNRENRKDLALQRPRYAPGSLILRQLQPTWPRRETGALRVPRHSESLVSGSGPFNRFLRPKPRAGERGVWSGAREDSMMLFAAAVLVLIPYAVSAQSVCEAQYATCMSACVMHPLAERCMQKCAPLRSRCPELSAPGHAVDAQGKAGALVPNKASRK